ncbi:MAG: LutB/LldF family L-lactate oxidation iron-sulfur protein [Acidobacteriaceae bacterium]
MTTNAQSHWSGREFPEAAKELLQDSQTRSNVRHATNVIQAKRNAVVGELDDWRQLRDAGAAIRAHSLAYLDHYLEQFEEACTLAGGQVHWARDGSEANDIILALIQKHSATEVLKIKTMTSEEIGLNEHLEANGVRAHETDLAELIIQLGHDKPSHFVVPALHKNRLQVREIFQREMHLPELGERPEDLATAARSYLREKYLRIKVAVSGANFLIAENGAVCIVESEGNGRMCLTLPDVLISVVGIEKVLPRYQDLEVFLQTLPRSATGERMNPYNSIWTGVREGDGPKEFHVVLLDNRRSPILADIESRQTLQCIRCAACLNVCPVYHQTGGHAYESVYAGPIGAILTPQLHSMTEGRSLPYASSLCGACYEVCPVKINIPEVLIHLRGKIVEEDQKTLGGRLGAWNLGMQAAAFLFASASRLSLAQHLGKIAQKLVVSSDGAIEHLPFMLSGWTQTRDLMPIPTESFREWWAKRPSPDRTHIADEGHDAR